ncbi:hypothetical protein H4R34_005109 [Dimargaris verticillata]|uniref:Uncharacterized protein n=1 Tax=Dimargaris verticillata TaxID=2761393 RepID=A0A9W8AZF2_9FUNG|nr:hypothetical protein H4R34_005109 [Dimargaris verticillata]
MVIPGKINSSVIRLLADFMALREKVKSTFSGSLLQDDETEAWLSVIIGTLKTAAGNQMHRMYDITERFLQFLVEEKVAVDDLANFLAYFIRVVLTGNMPLPEESVKGLAQKFVETCLKAEETNGTTGTMGAVEPTCPSERSPKEFNDVIYNQSLDYFLEISRSTMDERLHAIGAISAQKGIA